MNVQGTINKLVLGFENKGKIIKISVEECYSLKFHRKFKKYIMQETTETEIELKQKYYKLRKEYKENGKPPRMKEELKYLKTELDRMKILPVEFKNKIELLKYLSERYKELIA